MSNTPSIIVYFVQAILHASERLILPLPVAPCVLAAARLECLGRLGAGR